MSGSGTRHLEAFLEMMAAERGAARNTLAAYRADLEDLAAHLAARGLGLGGADQAALRDYLAAITAAGLSALTQARRLASIRQFHKFLLREGLRKDDPARLLDLPSASSVIAEEPHRGGGRSAAEEEAAAAPGLPGLAMRAGLEILYATGLRISEMLALPAAALTANAEMLLVRGKGDKERIVPLSDAARGSRIDTAPGA